MQGLLQKMNPRTRALRAFTLSEVVMAIALLTIVMQGVIYGYVHAARRAEWNGRSLAAQSLASQGIEQARAAKWDPQTWPVVDELPPTNFTTLNTLDIPVAGQVTYATNYVSVTVASANPLLRLIRSDCTWNFMGTVYTNTMLTLRAPDQ
jgi:type II secretory pathway pseudopilin PulG